MSDVLPYLIGLGLAATLAVLAIGIIAMFRGGEFNRKYGNKLMRLRVILQGVTVLLLVGAFVLLSKG